MKHHWELTFAEQPHADGQRRWDRVYQLLLEWAGGEPTAPNPPSPHRAAAVGGCWVPQELQARRENLRRGRASLAGQIERLTGAYLGGVVPLPEFQRRRVEFEQRDAALAAQQEQLSGEASRTREVAGLASSAEGFARRVSAGLATSTFEQKRQLVELLIDRVVVTGNVV